MSKTSDGTKDQPQFASSGNPPTFAADLTLLSDFYASRSFRTFTTVALMKSASGKAAGDFAAATNAPEAVFRYNGSTWDMIGVARFTTSSARSTAMAAPETGWTSRIDTERFDRRWNGSAWKPVGYGLPVIPTLPVNCSVDATTGLVTVSSKTSFSFDYGSDWESVEIESLDWVSSSAGNPVLQMRTAAGVDLSTGYQSGSIQLAGTSVSGVAGATSSWYFGRTDTTAPGHVRAVISNGAAAKGKVYEFVTFDSGTFKHQGGGRNTSTAAHTGVTISGPTMTATFKVRGLIAA